MLICSSCLENRYKNWTPHKSQVKCSVCEENKLCYIIPRESLREKRTKTKEEEPREEEIQYIYELLQACLEEDGYVIPSIKYADGKWKGFNVPLRNNKFTNMRDDLLVKIKWN